jgi:hypothetical protein
LSPVSLVVELGIGESRADRSAGGRYADARPRADAGKPLLASVARAGHRLLKAKQHSAPSEADTAKKPVLFDLAQALLNPFSEPRWLAKGVAA